MIGLWSLFSMFIPLSRLQKKPLVFYRENDAFLLDLVYTPTCKSWICLFGDFFTDSTTVNHHENHHLGEYCFFSKHRTRKSKKLKKPTSTWRIIKPFSPFGRGWQTNP